MILLESGAETYRVEDTMQRICFNYGADTCDAYATPTMLLVSFLKDGELYHNIKTLRQKLGLTQTQLAERLGYRDKSMIAKIEKGTVDLPQSKILSFADVLGVTPSELMGWQNNQLSSNDLHPITKKRLPLLGSIACGTPIFANEDRESYVMVGTDVKADFCLIAKGDSMINARINDGDVVFVKNQSTVENGEIAVVLIDDEATLKRFYLYRDKEMVILRAENPKYEDMIYIGEELNDIRIIGKAVFFQSDVE